MTVRGKKRLVPIIHPFLIGVTNILIFTMWEEAMKRYAEKVVLWYTSLIVSDYLKNSSKLIAFLNRSSLKYLKGAECPHVWRLAMTHVNTPDLHKETWLFTVIPSASKWVAHRGAWTICMQTQADVTLCFSSKSFRSSLIYCLFPNSPRFGTADG